MNKKRFTAILAAGSLLSTGFVLTPAAMAEHKLEHQQKMDHHQAPPIQGSIQLTPEQVSEAHKAASDTLQLQLKRYAKITAEQAEKAAEKAVRGAKVDRSVLHLYWPSRSLIYVVSVHVNDQQTIVIVDAGNGKVLETREMKPKPAPYPAPAHPGKHMNQHQMFD